jgi:hypothetical protein
MNNTSLKRGMSSLSRTGQRGLCPCCQKPTFIALGTLTGNVSNVSWIASKALIEELALSVWQHYHERVTRQTQPSESGELEIVEQLTPSVWCNRCGTAQPRLIWLSLAEQGLSGPFCKRCAYITADGLSDEDGAVAVPTVYVIGTHGAALQTVLAVAKACLQESEPPTAVTAAVRDSGEDVAPF